MESFRCQYVANRTAVDLLWGLPADRPEVDVLRTVEAGCPSHTVPVVPRPAEPGTPARGAAGRRGQGPVMVICGQVGRLRITHEPCDVVTALPVPNPTGRYG
ncbi:hypothetical protein ACWGB8_29960 [Kitasatospora sp. NPDC054939]